MKRRTAVPCIALAFASIAPLSEVAHAQVDLDCRDFQFQEDAQAHFDMDPSDPDRLDEDQGPDDGIACEVLPRRGSTAVTPAPVSPSVTPTPVSPTATPTPVSPSVTPTPVSPTAMPSRGVRGGVGGAAGPSDFDTGAGIFLVTGAAAGIVYTVLRRRRRA
ncbi:excalibur calcium-binding protein [Streptomyces sp. LHD-70]|uniref:excalibur calcium-binding protein n=1 Tax=Streptomyces sp. LHD-70 TaxID=3072140 RepID=UPI00280DA7EC|nr:excalibur calcium-binding protein [Streptomyces sp. LHD-70]MDQ8704525.1 excalibur calcium-binding protein [Streptomyces sp. LHD-70]